MGAAGAAAAGAAVALGAGVAGAAVAGAVAAGAVAGAALEDAATTGAAALGVGAVSAGFALAAAATGAEPALTAVLADVCALAPAANEINPAKAVNHKALLRRINTLSRMRIGSGVPRSSAKKTRAANRSPKLQCGIFLCRSLPAKSDFHIAHAELRGAAGMTGGTGPRNSSAPRRASDARSSKRHPTGEGAEGRPARGTRPACRPQSGVGARVFRREAADHPDHSQKMLCLAGNVGRELRL